MDQMALDWLLEEDNPSVRYFCLVELMGTPENEPVAIKAKKAIMESPIIKKILEKQNPDGSWGDPLRFYVSKYTGTVWSLLILAELGADGKNPQIKKACEFILNNSQEPISGGFSMERSAKVVAGLPGKVIPCLTGNVAYALIKFGYLNDPRVQKAIAWIVKYQRADDGLKLTPQEKEYQRLTSCFGDHTYHMGAAKALKALLAIPAEDRTAPVNAKISQLAEYFLIHRIYKSSHHPDKAAKPGWMDFGFPLMYNSDALELLGIFAHLHIKDPRLGDAISLVKSKMDGEGKWLLANTHNGKMLVTIEDKGKPSKWITLRALEILKEYQ